MSAAAAPAALLGVAARIAATLEAETASLAGGKMPQEDGAVERKALLLLEFLRAARGVGADELAADPALAAALGRMKAAIEANHAALGVRLDAARRVAETLARIVADVESDGTYAAVAARSVAR
jgi:hypothetical protein